MTVAEALITLLRGAGGVENRVYLNKMPDDNKKSCIVINLVQQTTAPEGGIFRDHWQVNGYCKGWKENGPTLALMKEVEDRLHRFSGVVDGLHIQRIMVQPGGGLRYENDTQWWHGYRDYAINYTTLEGR